MDRVCCWYFFAYHTTSMYKLTCSALPLLHNNFRLCTMTCRADMLTKNTRIVKCLLSLCHEAAQRSRGLQLYGRLIRVQRHTVVQYSYCCFLVPKLHQILLGISFIWTMTRLLSFCDCPANMTSITTHRYRTKRLNAKDRSQKRKLWWLYCTTIWTFIVGHKSHCG